MDSSCYFTCNTVTFVQLNACLMFESVCIASNLSLLLSFILNSVYSVFVSHIINCFGNNKKQLWSQNSIKVFLSKTFVFLFIYIYPTFLHQTASCFGCLLNQLVNQSVIRLTKKFTVLVNLFSVFCDFRISDNVGLLFSHVMSVLTWLLLRLISSFYLSLMWIVSE